MTNPRSQQLIRNGEAKIAREARIEDKHLTRAARRGLLSSRGARPDQRMEAKMAVVDLEIPAGAERFVVPGDAIPAGHIVARSYPSFPDEWFDWLSPIAGVVVRLESGGFGVEGECHEPFSAGCSICGYSPEETSSERA